MNKCKELTAVSIDSHTTLALGGMTLYRRPVQWVRHLIHQETPPTNLTLLTFTGGLASDMLIGADCVSHLRTCYMGFESFGLAPMFTQAVQNGSLTIIEESEASIACGLRASMSGIGFMPSRAWQGTDYLTVRPDVQTIIDPYTQQPVTAFPAIQCDTAVIHVLQADKKGNGRLGGNPTIDLELATVAKTVILTAEEVVDQLDAPIDIPAVLVNTVIEMPYGAWPTSCYPHYPLAGEAILDYTEACHAGKFNQYVRTLHHR